MASQEEINKIVQENRNWIVDTTNSAKETTDLPLAAPIVGTDLVRITQAGVSKKLQVDELGGVQQVVAGSNITVDNTDPTAPIVSSIDLLPLDNVWTGTNEFKNNVVIEEANGDTLTLSYSSLSSNIIFTKGVGSSAFGEISYSENAALNGLTIKGVQNKEYLNIGDGISAYGGNGFAFSATKDEDIVTKKYLDYRVARSEKIIINSDITILPDTAYKDGETIYVYSGASPITVTLGFDYTFALDGIKKITFLQKGDGQITFTGGTSPVQVIVDSAETLKTRKKNSFVTAIWITDNNPVLTGDLELL